MNLRNRVVLIGDVVSDPVYREFSTGKKLARFSVKTTDVFKRDKEIVKETMWHNVTAWEEVSLIVKNKIYAGIEVVVDGHLVNRKYTDQAGVLRYITEVVADTIITKSSNLSNSLEKRA